MIEQTVREERALKVAKSAAGLAHHPGHGSQPARPNHAAVELLLRSIGVGVAVLIFPAHYKHQVKPFG